MWSLGTTMTTSPRQNLIGNYTQDNLAYLWATINMTTNMANIYAAGRQHINRFNREDAVNSARCLAELYSLLKEAESFGIIAETYVEKYPDGSGYEVNGIDCHLHHDNESFHFGVHVDIEGHEGYPRGYIHSTGRFRYEDNKEHIKCSTWPELAKLLRERA
jgi:hypothetical protein